ncbi:MBL fold metallo-hydrolase [Hasllibacter sp. MH4015]|uniref:MBL fold metallo-hydrolase n=1 Tax=Hasllibacter sp. MH4015 TaxID=2854029 RepID=UPI001CD4C54B|nr:MBL fold metallo-hydrolase [Hasllibacter sp. MH4015]
MLCKIGDIEVWRILELNGPFREAETLYPNAGPDVAGLMEEIAPGQIEKGSTRVILPVQGFLLRTPDHVILVDACVGNHKTFPSFETWNMRDSDRFLAALTAAGATPDEVDYVFCTHLHVDHVGWNTRLLDGRWVPTFPNARYLLPKADLAMFEDNPHPMYDESILPVIEAGQAEEVGPDHALGDHVTLISTPGHTPGHVSVRIRSQGQEAVITGDAIHTTPQCAFPEWHFVYDSDPELAVTSRRHLLESVADSGARVLGTHFQLPSLGRIRTQGDAFEWVAD